MGHEDIDKIAALIKRISAKYTILMVEHNLNVVANLSDIITVLTAATCWRKAIMPICPRTSGSRKPIWGRVMPDMKMAESRDEIGSRIGRRHDGAFGSKSRSLVRRSHISFTASISR